MGRMIDADALKEECERRALYKWNQGVCPMSWADAYMGFIDDIDAAPTIDAVPVRRGEWEKLVWGDAYDNRERRCYRCSRCNKENAVRRNFCPNCGADMRPEKTKEE